MAAYVLEFTAVSLFLALLWATPEAYAQGIIPAIPWACPVQSVDLRPLLFVDCEYNINIPGKFGSCTYSLERFGSLGATSFTFGVQLRCPGRLTGLNAYACPVATYASFPLNKFECRYGEVNRLICSYNQTNGAQVPSSFTGLVDINCPRIPALACNNLGLGNNTECANIMTPFGPGSTNCACGDYIGGSVPSATVCQANVQCANCTNGCTFDADCPDGYNCAGGCGGVRIRPANFSGVCLPNCGTAPAASGCLRLNESAV
ncbi:hypothetical protein KFL_003280050 [Klebsormidium nitens]|uniref:EGF-like domain-containing protein n=1 Tax=Klebsormidium nitens TaxID=105231 RepID=A0A1Y1ID72_KLENI|nr:hypothetical protein KFL_003280050 [Klebsormidium nitens]|eukprot:GAQ87051.1 hypothetical protein KFL_003280050 [Klebsormidium nitens]